MTNFSELENRSFQVSFQKAVTELEPPLPLRRAHRSGCGLDGKIHVLLSEFLAPGQGLSVNSGATDISIWCLSKKAHLVNKNKYKEYRRF